MTLDTDGTLVKQSLAHNLHRATQERVTVASPAEFAEVLDTLEPSQALAYGVSGEDFASVVTRKAKEAGADGITRTRNNFAYPKGPGVLMLDHDPAPGPEPLTGPELLALLYLSLPCIKVLAHLWRPSASSCIYRDDGTEVRGIAGQRVYLLVKDAGDIPRAGAVLHARAWRAGHGFYLVSKSGALLDRGPFDAVVWQPERLDYCGGADCGPGLEQRLPPTEVYGGPELLDTRAALPDLTDDEQAQVAALKRDAKSAKRPEQEQARERYIEDRAPKLAEQAGIEVEQARETLRRAVEGDTLQADFVLHVGPGESVTVAQVLADPERYHKHGCLDPLEPEYQRDNFEIARIYCDGHGAPFVESFAHGGRRSMLEEPSPADTVQSAIERIKARGEPGPAMEPATIKAMAVLMTEDRSAYANFRHALKSSHPGVLIGDVTKAVEANNRALFPGDDDSDKALADSLIALVADDCELFHDREGDAYATTTEAPRQTYDLQTKAFRERLSYLCFKKLGKAPSDQITATAITGLSGQAKHDGPEHPVHLRAAPAPGGGYLIDLCNDQWSAVHVTATGWRVVAEPPVRFRRSQAMRPLPDPVTDGDLAPLWELVNIPQADRVLVLAWLFECWRPETPFPILELIGGHGSGKSDTQDRLRDVTDPSAVNLRAAPKDVESIHVGANSSWLVSYNNLSALSPEKQDALCTLATGGGFAKRTLYTDKDESIIESKRPVIINGIEPLGTAQDMIDRAVRLELPTITKRRKSSDLKTEFEQARPAIFGALLDLFALTLAELPNVDIPDPPRMADFAEIGEAVRRAMGEEQPFAKVYAERREQAITQGIEASPAALALLDLAESFPPATADRPQVSVFDGSFKTLLKTLSDRHRDGDAWPKSAKGLAGVLKRQAPAFSAIGIKLVFEPKRKEDGYHLTVTKLYQLGTHLSEGKKAKQRTGRTGSTGIEAQATENPVLHEHPVLSSRSFPPEEHVPSGYSVDSDGIEDDVPPAEGWL